MFVLDDGGEVLDKCSREISVIARIHICSFDVYYRVHLLQADLDLGNYERFLDIKLTRDHSITVGKIHHVCMYKLLNNRENPSLVLLSLPNIN